MAPRTIGDLMADFRSYIPHVQDGECQALVWKALQLIHGEEDLSFFVAEPPARIVTEAAYSTGTITIVGTAITLTGGAWNPAWTGRRLIVAGRAERYSIAITGAASGTITEAYLGTETTDLTYTLFRDVYELPANCEFSKEIVVFDVLRKEEITFVDYEALVFERERSSARPGQPLRVARVGLSADGKPQLLFDPPPSAAAPYLVPYYRSATKPATLTTPLDPPWPNAFHDVPALRAVVEYANRKGHPRRAEWAKQYRVRMRKLRSKCDGGNELRRRLRDRRLEDSAGIVSMYVTMREG